MNDIDIKISEKVAEEAGKQMNQLKKQIESFDISCSDNGYLYNQKDYGTAQSFENLQYSNLQDVQWMPNCEKFDLEIREKTGVDTSQVQLNISDSKRSLAVVPLS